MPGSCLSGGTWGARGAQGLKKNFFLNMFMWHIKLMGMMSRTISLNYDARKFHPNKHHKRYKTYRTEFSIYGMGHAPGVGLRGAGGKKLERGDLRWRTIDCAF